MNLDKHKIQSEIKAKVVEIAGGIGVDATALGSDDILPAMGLLDSAGIFELVAWYEVRFDIPLSQDEINIDNLGSLARMAEYVERRKEAD